MNFTESTQVTGVASVLVLSGSLLAMARVMRLIGGATDAGQRVLRHTGYVLLAVGLLGAWVLIGGGFGLFAWLLTMGIWIRGAMHYRALQRRNLFSALVLGVQRQMPLSPVARAVAAEQ